MSCRVLVVPEDPTNNGYILKPVISKLMAQCGKPNAQVVVMSNPKAGGYTHAKALLVSQVLERYAHFDLILFIPDGDQKDRSEEFKVLEQTASDKGVKLICCSAVPEVEAWLLSGHLSKIGMSCGEMRAQTHLKEKVFEPFLAAFGDPRRAGGGRDLLISETLQNYDGLVQRCPELGELEKQVRLAL